MPDVQMFIITPLQALFRHFARWQDLQHIRPWSLVGGAPCLRLLRHYHHWTVGGGRRAAAPCHARGRPLRPFEPTHLHAVVLALRQARGERGLAPR